MTHSLLNKNLPLLFQCLNDWLWVLFFFALGWAYLTYQKTARSVRTISILPTGVQKTKVISLYDLKWKLLLPRPFLTKDKIYSSDLRNMSLLFLLWWRFPRWVPFVRSILQNVKRVTWKKQSCVQKAWERIEKKLADEQLASTLQDFLVFLSNKRVH